MNPLQTVEVELTTHAAALRALAIALVGDKHAADELRLRALLPPGVGEPTVEVRVWQQRSGRGAVMAQLDDGAFFVDGLAADFYRVEIGGEAVGWRDLGQHWVDGKSECDLRLVDLPRPGHVRISRADDVVGTPEFYLRQPHGDVRAEDVAGGCRDDLSLPAGRRLGLWRNAQGRVGGTEFQVRAGTTSEVRIGTAVGHAGDAKGR